MKEYHKKLRVVLAVTGASGTIYARKTASALLSSDSVEHIAFIVSANGEAVARFEGEALWTLDKYAADKRLEVFDNNDTFAPPASGSSDYDVMIVVPCSMGCMGRIAAGISNDLITRSADVMLKERKKLILVVRETPFNTIHLRNLTSLSESGAIIAPASPSFYSHPVDIESLCDTVVERIVSLAGVEIPHFRWSEHFMD